MIKKKDFIELDYTGRVKEDGFVFDTTDEKTAKENNLADEKSPAHPAVVCVGENMILESIDNQLPGKEIGKTYKFDLTAEQAFGKKDAGLIKMLPLSTFSSQKIEPYVGLQVTVDGILGVVKRSGGGRILVDFNHPLAGKDLLYEVKINKVIDDTKEKIKAILLKFGIDSEIKYENDKATVKIEKTDEETKKIIKEKILGLTSVKDLSFEEINLNISKE